MSPFQLYIGLEREVRKYKDNLQLSTADLTYWLNKALNEYVDNFYKDFDSSEENKQTLGGLIDSGTLSLGSTNAYDSSTNLNTYSFGDTNTRFLLSERVSVTIDGTTYTYNVKPITIDELTSEVRNPYSPYKIHMTYSTPLRYIEDNDIILVSDSNSTLGTYTYIRLLNPTPFTIASALDTSEYTELPSKTHTELITIATRQIIENENTERYQTYNIEEIKSK